jgi:hypothetical protein
MHVKMQVKLHVKMYVDLLTALSEVVVAWRWDWDETA